MEDPRIKDAIILLLTDCARIRAVTETDVLDYVQEFSCALVRAHRIRKSIEWALKFYSIRDIGDRADQAFYDEIALFAEAREIDTEEDIDSFLESLEENADDHAFPENTSETIKPLLMKALGLA